VIIAPIYMHKKNNYKLQLWASNPILRSIAEKVENIDSEIQEFCHILQELLREYEGVWLAAPQIGRSLRIIATTQRKKAKRGSGKVIGETIMINPEITKQSETQHTSEEACLSLPWIQWDVHRYDRIQVEYSSPDWKKHNKKFHDFDAVIIQHEIDHIDGILFIDKLTN